MITAGTWNYNKRQTFFKVELKTNIPLKHEMCENVTGLLLCISVFPNQDSWEIILGSPFLTCLKLSVNYLTKKS